MQRECVLFRSAVNRWQGRKSQQLPPCARPAAEGRCGWRRFVVYVEGMNGASLVTGGAAGDVSWKVATRTPPPELAGYVRGLYGYVERSPALLRRREIPAPQAVVIFQL